MALVNDLVTALANKHEVTVAQVNEALDMVLTGPVFRRTTGSAFGELTEFGLIAYRENGPMPLGPIKHTVKRLLVRELERILCNLSTADDLKKWKKITGQTVRGTIGRISSDGSLGVILGLAGLLGEVTDEIVGICPKGLQPPRERNYYRSGETRWFYVNSVKAIKTPGGISAVRVELSRTATILPVSLLRREMPEKIKMSCTRRVVGKISYILAERQLPREAILKVGKELGERVKVKYPEKDKGARA